MTKKARRVAFCGFLLLICAVKAQGQQGSRGGEIELRLAQVNPSAGSMARYWARGERDLFIESTSLVEPTDVEDVRVSRHKDRIIFDIILKQDGEHKVALRTVDYAGRYIAFLVEGQLVDAFELKGRIGGSLTRWHALSVSQSAMPPGSVERIERRYSKQAVRDR